jgi:hypothetical protein
MDYIELEKRNFSKEKKLLPLESVLGNQNLLTPILIVMCQQHFM